MAELALEETQQLGRCQFQQTNMAACNVPQDQPLSMSCTIVRYCTLWVITVLK
jgi:hypothetical protein